MVGGGRGFGGGLGRVATAERDWLLFEELKAGRSWKQAASVVGVAPATVAAMVRRTGGVAVRKPVPSTGRLLSLGEREEIHDGLVRGLSFREIGRCIGRSGSTVSREVNANGGRERYRPWRADVEAEKRRARPKTAKLVANRRLCDEVASGLKKGWSPHKIQIRLPIDFPDDEEMRVSHETIYQSIFIQSRGVFRVEMSTYLDSRRTHRTQKPAEKLSRIKDLIPISKRPPEVEDRAVPGHWEGDLILGKNGLSQIATLVERTTRYVLLAKPDSKHAPVVCDVLVDAMRGLPESMKQTLTWDRGTEMADHVNFTLATDIDVYFCDPHSPWQRGTNENTNRLLRRYFPKGMDLSQVTDQQLREVEMLLNDRPRETLDGYKPVEVYNQLVATTH